MAVSSTERWDVVHVSSVHVADDNRILARECRSLAAHGFSVALVARAEVASVVDGVTVVPFPSWSGRGRRVVKGLPAMARTLRGLPATTYHLHDPELLALVPWLRLRGARVVYDAHEDLPTQMLAKRFGVPGATTALSVVARLVCWALGRSCDRVVAATAPVARRYPAARTTVVRNFPEILDDLDDAPYGERSDTAIYVGLIAEVRGTDTMIRAAQLGLPAHWRLRLVGPVDDQPRVPPEPGGAPVVWEGRTPPREARAMMADARVGLVVLHPTAAYVEALPTKLFEYMSAGLPVVASDFPAWREVVGDSDCALFVDPLRPEAVAEALRWLVEHPEEAEAMGTRGRAAVRGHLNWASEERELIALHRGLRG